MAVAARAETTASARAARRELRTSPRPRSRPRPRRTAGGIVWIAAVGALLAGVVAMNVAVLKLNLRYDRLAEQRAELRGHNAELAARLAGIETSARIQELAREELALMPAEPEQVSYVDLPRSRR